MQLIDKEQMNLPIKKQQNVWHSLATKFRKKRIMLFEALIEPLPRPLHILDVGGTQVFWETMEFIKHDVKVVVHNKKPIEVTHPSLTSIVGDARNLQEFKDKEFDIAFSNSVIEHVGTFEQQRQMAEELQRVGERYFVQTPNRYFPIEPHYLYPIPFYHFLPLGLKVFILTHFKTPYGWKITDKQKAAQYICAIRLLTEKEVRTLFPGATLYREKFFGLTKSIIVYKGW